MTHSDHCTRREFLSASASCGAYLAAIAPILGPAALRRWRAAIGGRVVAQTPFARIEEVGANMYAIISTPLEGDFTTTCNGGIVGGSSGTLVYEAFNTPEGARWVAEQARDLTGRWPDHVVVSHFHGDHSAGPSGFVRDSGRAPALRATRATQELVHESRGDATAAPWADVTVLLEDGPLDVDLGDRMVAVVPRRGHTASDVTIEVDGGEGPVWCGDLVWNAMFPNYTNAVPSQLSRTVRALQAMPASTYVPGHGPLTDDAAMTGYVALIDLVEEAARTAWRRGMEPDEAAEAFEVPASLGEWYVFNPSFYQRAMQAWMSELDTGSRSTFTAPV